jgi:hypothetical protein
VKIPIPVDVAALPGPMDSERALRGRARAPWRALEDWLRPGIGDGNTAQRKMNENKEI